jgi:ParB family chromosome partitioning protein
MKIGNIAIGQRHRRDMGDIAGLAQSISEIGLLHPVVVTPQGELIAGERRIAAAQRLGWTDIAATVVDIADLARGEAHENFQRKDFTHSEAVSIKRALEPEMKEAARERQAEGGRNKASANLAEAGDARDKVAAFTGFGRTSLDKADDAARSEAVRK